MSNTQKIWMITGISRGLGKELARAVLIQGDVVIGTTRSGTVDLGTDIVTERLHVLPMELSDVQQIRAAVGQAHAFHGRLDVIVNNAGYGLLGAIEEATDDEAEKVFAINFFGPLNVIRAALPFLRAQRSGHIVNVSALAGLVPMAGWGLYSAAKSAIEGMSQSLAQEVAPLGIRVTSVEPGAFRTDFLSDHSIRYSDHRIDDYAPTAHANVAYLNEIVGKRVGDPKLGALAMIKAVEAETPPMHLVLGSDALGYLREHLAQLTSNLSAWESVSLSTDFAV